VVILLQEDEKIELLEGEVFSLIRNLPAGESFEIRTPTAIVGARGTEWVTKFKEETTEVETYENNTFLKTFDESGQIKKEETIVAAGYSTAVKRFQAPEPFRPLPEVRQQRWQQMRHEVNDRIQAVRQERGRPERPRHPMRPRKEGGPDRKEQPMPGSRPPDRPGERIEGQGPKPPGGPGPASEGDQRPLRSRDSDGPGHEQGMPMRQENKGPGNLEDKRFQQNPPEGNLRQDSRESSPSPGQSPGREENSSRFSEPPQRRPSQGEGGSSQGRKPSPETRSGQHQDVNRAGMRGLTGQEKLKTQPMPNRNQPSQTIRDQRTNRPEHEAGGKGSSGGHRSIPSQRPTGRGPVGGR
jgi:hypothetical protein